MSLVITDLKQKTHLEHTFCDFCGVAKTSLFLEAENQEIKEKFKIVKCDNCGLLYLNPRPIKEIIGRYYPVDSYYSYQDFSDKKRFNYREWLKKISLEGYYKSKNIFKKLISKVLIRNLMIVVPKERKGRLLDIGCGSGEFLNQMKGFGWEVYGVEINSEAVGTGKRKGLNIFCGELGGADFPDNFFDVVVLNQTLEHVYSPSAYLKETHRILKPEGSLIIGVPNIDCIERKIFKEYWHGLDVPRHIYFFSISSLRRYLERHEFEIERIISKRFCFRLKGIKADLKLLLRNKDREVSMLSNVLTCFQSVLRLLVMKTLKSLFPKAHHEDLDIFVAFYARKPASGKTV